MRYLTRMGLGLVGLALVGPPAAWADPPQSRPPATGKKAQTPPRRSWFQKEHLCAKCQWLDLRAKGINNIPPPPPLPQGTRATPGNQCDRCGGPVATVASCGLAVAPLAAPPAPAPQPEMVGMAAPGGTCVPCAAAAGAPVVYVPEGARMIVVEGGGMPGRAVAGGNGPGYAVAEPTPIGTIQGRYAYQGPGGAGMPMGGGHPGPGGGPGSSDPSVLPSSFATAPYIPDDHNRPHVLTHLFGLDAIGARRRAERARRARENHAAISYQPQDQPVSDLPAAMVYGR